MCTDHYVTAAINQPISLLRITTVLWNSIKKKCSISVYKADPSPISRSERSLGQMGHDIITKLQESTVCQEGIKILAMNNFIAQPK
jgi:hypothetical protein